MSRKVYLTGMQIMLIALMPVKSINALELSSAWYVGAGIGASWLDPETSNTAHSVSDDQDFSWHLLGGYRINQNFSVELAYTDLGRAEITSSGTAAGDVRYRQTTLGVLWSPILKSESTWRPYIKGGVNYSDRSWDQGALITDDWGMFGGIGVEKFFGRNDFALRAEYTAYAKDAQAVSFSLVKFFSD